MGQSAWAKSIKTCWCKGPSQVTQDQRENWGNAPVQVNSVSFLPPEHFLLYEAPESSPCLTPGIQTPTLGGGYHHLRVTSEGTEAQRAEEGEGCNLNPSLSEPRISNWVPGPELGQVGG